MPGTPRDVPDTDEHHWMRTQLVGVRIIAVRELPSRAGERLQRIWLRAREHASVCVSVDLLVRGGIVAALTPTVPYGPHTTPLAPLLTVARETRSLPLLARGIAAYGRASAARSALWARLQAAWPAAVSLPHGHNSATAHILPRGESAPFELRLNYQIWFDLATRRICTSLRALPVYSSALVRTASNRTSGTELLRALPSNATRLIRAVGTLRASHSLIALASPAND